MSITRNTGITGIALIPAAPVLVAELGGSTHPAGEPIRAAQEAITRLIATNPDRILVIAEGDDDQEYAQHTPIGLHRFGGQARETATEFLPPNLAIGAALLEDAGWTKQVTYRSLKRASTIEEVTNATRALGSTEEAIGLLLLGNGSACCTPKAPGSFRDDAERFNESVVNAITNPTGLDLALSRESFKTQLSDVRIPLIVFREAIAETVDSRTTATATTLHFAQEFQGVFYVCTSTTAPPSSSP